jgi:hypothetical protein
VTDEDIDIEIDIDEAVSIPVENTSRRSNVRGADNNQNNRRQGITTNNREQKVNTNRSRRTNADAERLNYIDVESFEVDLDADL